MSINWMSIIALAFPVYTYAQCLSGNCYNGQGKFKYTNEAVYEGIFKNGQPHGQGVLIYSNGNRYDGEWRNGKKSGEGVLNFTNGARYEGQFDHNFMDGFGQYTFKDGSRYEGFFEADRPNGQGSLIRLDGSKISGLWKDGKLQSESAEEEPGTDVVASGQINKSENVVEYKPVKKTNVSDGQVGDVNIYAVIVGVSRYENFETLKYSDDDAYRIYAFLKSPEGGAVPDENIHILIDESAVKENIVQAMESVAAKADENDAIICYLAGHGLEGYFLPIDSDGYRRRIPYLSLRKYLEESPAKQKLFMVDACYSGSLLASRSPNLSQIQNFYQQISESAGGTAFLLSSKEAEYSKESSGLRQGVFSYFLIEGMKGKADLNQDQIVTIEELYQYIQSGVRKYTKNEQNPQLAGRYQSDLPVSWVRN